MRLVIDECTGPSVARWLRGLGHDVVSVYDEAPQLPDVDILAFAVRENRIVITNDKDFGELVFRDQRPHRGVVLLRLSHDAVSDKITALERFLADVPSDLSICFVVVTDRSVRITRDDTRSRE
jgi:predicted nuclease of predicted toxin-antitoxin system